LHHAAGDDHDGQPRLGGSREHAKRARSHHAVLPDQRVVEVRRDDAGVVREPCGKVDQPPEAWTTYAETSAIWRLVSWP
jgi:hypothetical protein